MKITPIDIQHLQFEKRILGYDVHEVDMFLQNACDTIESLMEEKKQMSEKIRRLRSEIRAYKSREASFREVMITSNKTIEEMKRAVRKKSELVIAKAEMDAEKIINSASEKLSQLYDEINELLRQRTRFRESLKSEINTHKELLEIFSLNEADDSEGNFQVRETLAK